VVFETVEDKYGTLVVELLQVIDWCLQDVSPRPAKKIAHNLSYNIIN
jgi:hypothetical protein